jgi:hypothetical protein
MTQKDLANKINEKQTVVADYESGKVSFERDVWEKQSHKPVEKKKGHSGSESVVQDEQSSWGAVEKVNEKANFFLVLRFQMGDDFVCKLQLFLQRSIRVSRTPLFIR